MLDENDIICRLRKRAQIRRQIPTRKSVQEGLPDRLADLLDEAADEIGTLREVRDFYLAMARNKGEVDEISNSIHKGQ
jgi:hypothetical protein